MVERLSGLQKQSLKTKNIQTKQELAKVIRVDSEKFICAMYELKNKSTFQVLNNFFGEGEKDKEDILGILPQLEKQNLDHIGFEINQPLDILIPGLNHRFSKWSNDADAKIKVSKIFRFPASQAFQDRVGAYTEIMRLLIEGDDWKVMLELFDIHRPVDIFQWESKQRIDQAYIRNLLTSKGLLMDNSENIAHHNIFQRDSIWHYAICVDSQSKVNQLHDYLRILANKKDKTYKLPFESVVHNKNDGSVLTKIINKNNGLELEFVTQS